MVSKSTDIKYLLTRTEEEALILENNLIKKYSPAYNCLLKWDNGYTYIRITKWKFPKIEFTRYKDKPWVYIWPKPWKKDTKNTLQILRQILKFRTCTDTKFKQWKLCSDFMLWLCSWWCKSSENSNYLAEKEYKQIVKVITDFFDWKTNCIKKIIKEKIVKKIKKKKVTKKEIIKKLVKKKELKKKKIKLSLSEEAEWEDYFLKEQQKALDIKSKIDSTDAAIDQMVYELYGLTEEEIEIVENS